MQNNTLQIFHEKNLNQQTLNISGMDITGYINFNKFINIIEIKCHYNFISKIEEIRSNIKKLHCCKNRLSELDSLNNDLVELEELEELDCSYNYLTKLDNLPSSLIKLFIKSYS